MTFIRPVGAVLAAGAVGARAAVVGAAISGAGAASTAPRTARGAGPT